MRFCHSCRVRQGFQSLGRVVRIDKKSHILANDVRFGQRCQVSIQVVVSWQISQGLSKVVSVSQKLECFGESGRCFARVVMFLPKLSNFAQ